MVDHVLQALPAIYDAAIEDDRWIAALNDMVAPTGARATLLLVVEPEGSHPWSLNQFSDLYRTHLTPEEWQFYVKNYSPLEMEAWEKIKSMPRQQIIEDKEIWPNISEIRHRADYRYLEDKVGIFRRAVSRLNDNRCWYDTAIFQFDASITDIPEESLKSAQMLLPHLAKSIELSRAFSLLKTRYKAVLSALDHVQIGMCIALGRGEVIVSNQEAERIVDLDDGLKFARDGRFLCRDPELGLALNQAIERAARAAKGDGGLAETILAVPRLTNEHPFLVEIAPLRDYAGEVDTNLEGALVTVIDPGNPKPFSTARVAQAYGLTPAEAEVCRHLVDGWTNSRIADERSVSTDTVKTQIASILQKTSTKRRSELIRLALKSSPPIATPDRAS